MEYDVFLRTELPCLLVEPPQKEGKYVLVSEVGEAVWASDNEGGGWGILYEYMERCFELGNYPGEGVIPCHR